MKLERFRKNKSLQNKVIIGVSVIVGILIGLVLYRSFAYYEETKTFNILEGRVPVINKGDVKIAVLVDGVSKNEFPEKENHKYIGYECTNDATIAWNDENWKLTLDTSKPTVCTLSFVSISYVYKVGTTTVDELPPKKGHKYKSYTCTNEATLEWDKTNWMANVNYTNTSVCVIYFETSYGLSGNMAEALIESGELTKISNHSTTTQTGTNTQIDYRYVGENPNNYVSFNNELWRIIGVFNTDDGSGAYKWRVKIIRATGIGNLAWDSSNKNDWNNASLKKILNEAYLNRTGSYTSIGLNETARNQIESVQWYLGASDTTVTSEKLFVDERSNTKGGKSNSTSWTGYVGLMYLSDYGYSVDFTANASCSSINLSSYNDACSDNSWIYKSNFNNTNTVATSGTPYNAWTLTPRLTSNGDEAGVLNVTSTGNSGFNHTVDGIIVVRPVVYLNAEIELTDDTTDGSINNAYEIGLN